jgi:hypothetical protein
MPSSIEKSIRAQISSVLSQVSVELSDLHLQQLGADEHARLSKLRDDVYQVLVEIAVEDAADLGRKIENVANELENTMSSLARAKGGGYGSGTFKCKSDLDLCRSRATSPLESALCYALFTRCIMKG